MSCYHTLKCYKTSPVTIFKYSVEYEQKDNGDCWYTCGEKGGKCSICGDNGFCCSAVDGAQNGDCPQMAIESVANAGHHVCSVPKGDI